MKEPLIGETPENQKGEEEHQKDRKRAHRVKGATVAQSRQKLWGR